MQKLTRLEICLMVYAIIVTILFISATDAHKTDIAYIVDDLTAQIDVLEQDLSECRKQVNEFFLDEN